MKEKVPHRSIHPVKTTSKGLESDVSATASDNNQLQQQPCGIDHDLYMVFTGDVIIVFSSNLNFINNPIWPPVGWYNMVWQGRG